MRTKQAFILALVAVLGMCSSAFASPMLTVNTVSGEVTFWGSAAAASAVWSGSISNPGGEGDSALTGIQVIDSGLTGSGDAVALYTPDVITGAFPSVQASVFTVDNSYYAELLSPASLDDSVATTQLVAAPCWILLAAAPVACQLKSAPLVALQRPPSTWPTFQNPPLSY